jgi:hypothetical protein
MRSCGLASHAPEAFCDPMTPVLLKVTHLIAGGRLAVVFKKWND